MSVPDVCGERFSGFHGLCVLSAGESRGSQTGVSLVTAVNEHFEVKPRAAFRSLMLLQLGLRRSRVLHVSPFPISALCQQV